MIKNMSRTDGIIRFFAAVVIAILWYTETVTGTWMIVLAIAAAAFIITGFLNFCPLYSVLRIKTRKSS